MIRGRSSTADRGKAIALDPRQWKLPVAPASAGSATTNAQGQATFSVSDTQAETVTYSATDTTDGVDLDRRERQRHVRNPECLGGRNRP